MKKHIACLSLAAVFASACAFADDFDDLLDDDGASAPAASGDEAVSGGGEAAESGPAEGEDAVADAGASARPARNLFYLLPFCRQLEGVGEVAMPGSPRWATAEEGKYYPLGSRFRAVGAASRVRIKFGPECEVLVKGDSSIGTRAARTGDNTRAFDLSSGTVIVKLPNNMPAGAVTVNSPGFSAYNLAGRSRFKYTATGDGDEASIRCVTQAMSVKGRHFDITGMRAANEVRIRTSQDMLFTGIYGISGDVNVKLDQGRIQVKDYATGEVSEQDKTLDWRLSPGTAVRIHRAVPAIGERMCAAVMTFDARGELKNRCAFVEGLVEANTGELGPTSKKDLAELEKRAAAATRDTGADATETTESEPDDSGSSGSSGDAGDADDAGDPGDLGFVEDFS